MLPVLGTSFLEQTGLLIRPCRPRQRLRDSGAGIAVFVSSPVQFALELDWRYQGERTFSRPVSGSRSGGGPAAAAMAWGLKPIQPQA